MRWLLRIVALFALAVIARAQTGADIAQRHAERAGGKLEKLTAYRAEGRTFIGDKEVPFIMWAQRPDRLRIESSTPSRHLVQVYDGVHPPWTSHSEVAGGAPQLMSGAEAREFIANADFDDPLVNSEAKGYSVDYAGEDEVDGRTTHKVLVMSKTDDICFLWIDAESNEIVRRMTYRIVQEQRAVIDTYFKDFRPVAGVMFPHKVEARTNGRAIYTTLIDKMEPNPKKLPADLFARPGGWPEEKKTEEPKPDMPKPDEAKVGEAKIDETKPDAPKFELPKIGESKTDEPKPIEVKFEVIKPVELKPDAAKSEEPKPEEAPPKPKEKVPEEASDKPEGRVASEL